MTSPGGGRRPSWVSGCAILAGLGLVFLLLLFLAASLMPPFGANPGRGPSPLSFTPHVGLIRLEFCLV